MAAYTTKKLAFVQLPISSGSTTIYDPAVGTKGLIHNIILYNDNSSSETIVIKMHDGTNEYKLFQMVVIASDSVIVDFRGEGLVVDENSSLNGYTSTASMVTCLVNGSEETA